MARKMEKEDSTGLMAPDIQGSSLTIRFKGAELMFGQTKGNTQAPG